MRHLVTLHHQLIDESAAGEPDIAYFSFFLNSQSAAGPPSGQETCAHACDYNGSCYCEVRFSGKMYVVC